MADTSEMIIGEMVVEGDRLFYVLNKSGYEGIIVAREISTGKMLWKWGDPDISGGLHITSLEVADGKLVIESWANLYVVDSQSGTTIWKSTVAHIGECGSPRMSVIGNQIYFIVEDCSPEKKYTQLMRTPISQFAPEPIFRVDQITSSGPDSGWISGLERPSLWVNPPGDSILIFQNRAFKLGVLQNKVELFAYNLKDKALLWKSDAVTQEGNSSVHLRIVEGNFIYFVGYYSIHKIDAFTGQKVWSKLFPDQVEHFIYSNITIAGNAVFAHPGGNRLYALNGQTGYENWRIEQVGCCGVTGEMQLINQRLYYVSPPYFLNIDTDAGKIASKYESPLKFGMNYTTKFSQFARTISSPDKKFLLTSDDHYIMAIKAN